MGYRGLALGTALAAMFNAGALLWLLRRRLGGHRRAARIASRSLKILVRVASSMGVAAQLRRIAWLSVALAGNAARCVQGRARLSVRHRRRRRRRSSPSARVAPHRGDRRGVRARAAPPTARAGAVTCLSGRQLEHSRSASIPTILLMAGAHMMVDGYGNIYAPLLPLLIPRLGSVARRGRHPDDAVSDGGVGGAGRVRPSRGSLAAAPARHGRTGRRRSSVLSLIGLARHAMACSRSMLIVGGLGAAAFHPPAAALAHRLGGDRRGLAMSVYITGGTLGFSLGPLSSRRSRSGSASSGRRCWRFPGLAGRGVLPPARAADSAASVDAAAASGAAAVREAARRCSTLIVVLRTLASLAFATFVPVMLTRRGMSVGQAGRGGRDVSVRERASADSSAGPRPIGSARAG